MGVWRDRLRRLTAGLVGRYPFLNGVTLLLLLGERASREQYPPIEPMRIYINMGLFVVCGLCMTFDYKRKEAALVHVGQLLWLAYTLYSSPRLKYSHWLRIRTSARCVGVAAVFLMYSFFTVRPSQRSSQMLRMGETIMGIFLVAQLYTTMESLEDKNAFIFHVPGSTTSLYIYAILMAASALCYLPGFFINDITYLLIFVYTAVVLLVDGDVSYWSKKRGLDYWMQIRLLADNLCISLGMLMYLAFTKKKVYTDEE